MTRNRDPCSQSQCHRRSLSKGNIKLGSHSRVMSINKGRSHKDKKIQELRPQELKRHDLRQDAQNRNVLNNQDKQRQDNAKT